MKTVRSLTDLERELAALRKKGRVGLVPTMGALHEGHFKLVDAAKRENESVVATVFVNPLQFGPKEDFSKYPRTLEADARGLARRGAALLFAPEAGELLASPELKKPYVPPQAKGLCGDFRPGHFAGVSRIVALFFRLIRPDAAYFGLKDYQQFRVIEAMAAKQFPRIKIRPVETVREKDGLAMSSRNRYLSAKERGESAEFYRTLRAAAAGLRRGRKPAEFERRMRERLLSFATSVDYASIVNAKSLKKAKSARPKPAAGFLIAGAIRVGTTRLIDNVWVK